MINFDMFQIWKAWNSKSEIFHWGAVCLSSSSLRQGSRSHIQGKLMYCSRSLRKFKWSKWNVFLFVACALPVWPYFSLKIIDFLVTCYLGRRCVCVIDKSQIRKQDCMLHSVLLGWVFSQLSKTLTPFRNNICHFSYLIYDLIKNLIPSSDRC